MSSTEAVRIVVEFRLKKVWYVVNINKPVQKITIGFEQSSGPAPDKGTLWAKSHSAGSPILEAWLSADITPFSASSVGGTCSYRPRFQQIAENGSPLQNPACCVKSPINWTGKHIFAGCLKCGQDHGLLSVSDGEWLDPTVFKGSA